MFPSSNRERRTLHGRIKKNRLRRDRTEKPKKTRISGFSPSSIRRQGVIGNRHFILISKQGEFIDLSGVAFRSVSKTSHSIRILFVELWRL